MTWGATITSHGTVTADPPPGHRRRVGADSVRLVHAVPPPHRAVIGDGIRREARDPTVAHAVHLLRHQPAFYAACECERLPDHLREQG